MQEISWAYRLLARIVFFSWKKFNNQRTNIVYQAPKTSFSAIVSKNYVTVDDTLILHNYSSSQKKNFLSTNVKVGHYESFFYRSCEMEPTKTIYESYYCFSVLRWITTVFFKCALIWITVSKWSNSEISLLFMTVC